MPASTGTVFRLLGPLEVVQRGVVRDVPAGRQQALLATLLLRPNELVTAPALMERVWGGDADRSVLNVCVMRLRRSLQDHDHLVLRAEGGGYRIAVDESAVDLHRFRQLCGEAGQARARGQLERERTALHEALALWRGDAFTGISAPTLQSEVVPILGEEKLVAVEHRIRADLDSGAHAELVSELRGLVADHPFRERFWCQLLLALYRSGRQSEALDAYLTARTLFADELGVEPGPELRGLHQRILAADPTLLTPAGGPIVVPVGSGSAGLVPAQLPPAVAGFRGRADQFRELDRLLDLADPSVPIGLVVGSPGVGKTALTVQWASARRERWPDGQLFLDLRGYAAEPVMRPVEALARLLRALGVPGERVPSDVVEAGALYRSITVDKRMLVVLDNATSPDQVRPLLPAGRNCVVVVTSRDRLTGLTVREGARPLALDVLPDAEAVALLAAVVGADRVAAEPELADELVRVCGNLPLALRIVAADLASNPDRTLADQVAALRTGNRLDGLEVPGDDQAAVRVAFGSSYARLAGAARRMFRLLGLFPGPELGSAAAAALAGATPREATKLLDHLVSAHLLTPRGPDRLVLHDLLRLYATELTHHHDPEHVRRAAVQRLYNHYTSTVEAAARRCYPGLLRLSLSADAALLPVDFDDDRQASDWLDAERANLVAAVRHAAVHGPHLDGCRLAAGLRSYLHTRLHTVDWLTVSRASLAAARTIGDPRAQVTAHLNLAEWHFDQRQFGPALDHNQRALALSLHADWIEGQSTAHNNIASVHHAAGSQRSAADHLVSALVLNRRAGAVVREAANLGNLGRLQMQMGRTEEAVASLRRSLRLNRRVGDRRNEARLLASLGAALDALGEHARGRNALRRALTLQRELDDRQYLGYTMCQLAGAQLHLGEPARAVELAEAMSVLARETGRAEDEARSVRVIAAVDEANGHYDRAVEHYQRVLELAGASRQPYLRADALVGLAAAYAELGRPGPARQHADQATAIARRLGYQLIERRAAAIRPDVLLAR